MRVSSGGGTPAPHFLRKRPQALPEPSSPMKTTTHAKKPAHPAAKAKGKKVPFRLRKKTGKPVSLVGSFTGWEKQPIALTEVEPGVWFAEVELPAGRHEYLFLSDGE